MGPFSMVVAIVLIVTLGKVLSDRHKALGRAQDGQQQLPPADLIAARDEIRQLKERVAVLERVITDNHGSHDLSRQIDELRDH
ncbi:MAG: hypothetical protein JO221_00565 [Sphingomonas sp.]|uniref:Phage shock protein B n=1 Tax=Sphingomonas lycopersici TaxID=2951807 RepID=A0AA41Z822_9SPHN|nr:MULTISPECIES: hypothetical protein [Sphingomonas]MBV8237237.1 hypothetical protein [Sphingomonas sp.]MCW6529525.1 hypothetical protein [Sphingomonas lycopersici]MCW6534552.1 hypothetical protein [Sphingomonas lycopersici]OJU23140.1 MAG: hypothetical protein BGN95_02950 [Sphingomonas sp. 66-10]